MGLKEIPEKWPAWITREEAIALMKRDFKMTREKAEELLDRFKKEHPEHFIEVDKQ